MCFSNILFFISLLNFNQSDATSKVMYRHEMICMTLNEVEIATSNDRVLQAVMLCMVSGRWHQPPSDVSLAELSRYDNMWRMNLHAHTLCCWNPIASWYRLSCKTKRWTSLMRVSRYSEDEGPGERKGVVPEYGQIRRNQSKIVFDLPNRHTSDEPRTVGNVYITWPTMRRDECGLCPCRWRNTVIDVYSRFPFVEPVASEAVSAVIPKLDKIFATFGTPNVFQSVNGPPFNGQDFAKFVDVLGFKHRKFTPLWPRAEG